MSFLVTTIVPKFKTEIKLELGESGVSPHKYLTVNGIIFQEKWHLTSKGPNKIKYLNKERNVTQKI